MTTFTSTCIRLVTGIAMTLLLSLAVSSSSYAQACRCSAITVVSDPGVACTVTMYPSAPLCKYAPIPVAPGSTAQIGCCDDMMIRVGTCDGSDVVFSDNPNLPTCYTGVAIAPGCCVDICLTIDRLTRCPVIRITPSSVRCARC